MPAGSFAYKVALNGTWDENYGAGGALNGANIPLEALGPPITFTYDHATHVITDDAPVVLGSERAAHWLRRGLLAWDAPDAASYRLHVAPEGGLEVVDGTIPGDSYALTPSDAAVPGDFPHLAALDTFELSAAGQRAARELLTGQLIVAAYDAGGRLVDATGVQIPGVLDDLYASAAHARLGPTWHGRTPKLAVWAPTAKDVQLVLGERRLAMRRGRDGVWRIEGRPSWKDAAYAFAVTVYVPDEVVTNVVTDPYSLGLTLNSRRSLLVDLDDPKLEPHGWDRLSKPRLAQPEDSTIYELHVRDFSITDETVPARHRGTYLRLHRRPQRRHAPPAPPGRQRPQLPAPAALERHRDDRGGPLEAAGAGLRSAVLPAGLRGSSRRASSRSATPTASTGATTRCTTRRRRAPTRRGRTARHGRSSSARWSRASTAPACAW